MKSVIVGTAGHIDHGKTSLVKALTGIDADRLEEEKRRGITIDIGFAHLELTAPNGERLRLGFVDVPGHERFVRNMLAGIGGIDLVVLVIAADEGIKPQTREHFDICRLLAVQRGITVLTKSDAVDAETLEVVRMEVADFLKGSFLDSSRSPVLAASSLTGAGLDDVKKALAEAASKAQSKDANALARLPVDRVFTMKGFGTVVTGTLVSGTIRKEEELEIFPSGKRARVRGVQVHGQASESATAGQRTALNLAGVPTDDLERGVILAPVNTFNSTSRIDVKLSLLASAKPLKDGARVHFHSYTMETIAEVRLYGTKQMKPGEDAFAHLRLSSPNLLLPGDRFILRQFSPVVTIGGGIVLDAAPPRRGKKSEPHFLKLLDGGTPRQIIEGRIARHERTGLTTRELIAETGLPSATIRDYVAESIAIGQVLHFGDRYLHGVVGEVLKQLILDATGTFHTTNPLVAGISKEQLREITGTAPQVVSSLLDILKKEKKIEVAEEIVHLAGRGVVMKDEEAESKKIIEHAFQSAGLKVPSLNEVLGSLKVDKLRAQKIVTLLLRDKVLIKLSDELVFHQTALANLRQKISALKSSTPKIDVAQFKDMTGVSRKYAIPLLEYLDRERVTRRVGDARIIL
jgi:selenocysteine-specific elongation factor